MNRLHLLSWYSQGPQGESDARRFFDQLREGTTAGIRFPLDAPHQIGLVRCTDDPHWCLAIQVDTGTETDDSDQQTQALSGWFGACGADTTGTDRSVMAATRMTIDATLQSRFGNQYRVEETLDSKPISQMASAASIAASGMVNLPPTGISTESGPAEKRRGLAGRMGWNTSSPVFWVLFIPLLAVVSFLAYLGTDALLSLRDQPPPTVGPTTVVLTEDATTTTTRATSSTTTLLSLAQVPPDMAWAIERTFEYPELTHLVDFDGDVATSTPKGWRATDGEPTVTSNHTLSIRGYDVVQYTGTSTAPGGAVVARFKFVEGAVFTLGLDACPNRMPRLVGQDGFQSVSVEFRNRLFLNVWLGTERLSLFEDVGTVLQPDVWYTISVAITPENGFSITVWDDTSSDPIGRYVGDNAALRGEYCFATFVDHDSLLQVDDIGFIEFGSIK